MTQAKRRIGFVGAGRVAGALSLTLREAGYPVVAVASRTVESAQALAGQIAGCRATSAQEVADLCDLIFITTPDGAIRDVAASVEWRPGAGVVHTSGAETSAALDVAARRGASTGSLHPLQTFADHAQARMNLPGSVFAVEGEGWLRDELLEIVEALRGTPIQLRADEKVLYHASAVMLSNYTVTLAEMATDLWLRFGWERPRALRALLPLLKGAVNNIEALGVPLALTGPIARGDVETVRSHLEALDATAPELLNAYIELARRTIPVALARGGLTDGAARELSDLLDRTQGAEGFADLATNQGRKER